MWQEISPESRLHKGVWFLVASTLLTTSYSVGETAIKVLVHPVTECLASVRTACLVAAFVIVCESGRSLQAVVLQRRG
ncbi:hypothetical protein BC834DRAFT_858343, partial [Gloeopeniophorella convolvens]